MVIRGVFWRGLWGPWSPGVTKGVQKKGEREKKKMERKGKERKGKERGAKQEEKMIERSFNMTKVASFKRKRGLQGSHHLAGGGGGHSSTLLQVVAGSIDYFQTYIYIGPHYHDYRYG